MLFLGSRAFVYHETELWGAALALAAYDAILGFLGEPSRRRIVLADIWSTLAFLTRATVGAGPVIALAIVLVVVMLRRLSARGLDAPARWLGVPDSAGTNAMIGWLAAAVAVPVVLYAYVNYSRFGTFFRVAARQAGVFAIQRGSSACPRRQRWEPVRAEVPSHTAAADPSAGCPPPRWAVPVDPLPGTGDGDRRRHLRHAVMGVDHPGDDAGSDAARTGLCRRDRTARRCRFGTYATPRRCDRRARHVHDRVRRQPVHVRPAPGDRAGEPRRAARAARRARASAAARLGSHWSHGGGRAHCHIAVGQLRARHHVPARARPGDRRATHRLHRLPAGRRRPAARRSPRQRAPALISPSGDRSATCSCSATVAGSTGPTRSNGVPSNAGMAPVTTACGCGSRTRPVGKSRSSASAPVRPPSRTCSACATYRAARPASCSTVRCCPARSRARPCVSIPGAPTCSTSSWTAVSARCGSSSTTRT